MKMKCDDAAPSGGTPPGATKAFTGIVFDLDGTLIDSVPSLTQTLNGLLEEDGLAPLEDRDVTAMVGEGAGLLVARAYAAREGSDSGGRDPRQPRRLERFLERYAADPLTGTRPYEGARDLLAFLKGQGLVLGLCTNKPEAPARALLESLDLAPFLDAVVGGDTLAQRKPDPAPLYETLKRMGVPPDQALFVGDSAIDVRCARAAGVPVVVLAHGYAKEPPETLAADAVFQDCPALGRWLEAGSRRAPEA